MTETSSGLKVNRRLVNCPAGSTAVNVSFRQVSILQTMHCMKLHHVVQTTNHNNCIFQINEYLYQELLAVPTSLLAIHDDCCSVIVLVRAIKQKVLLCLMCVCVLQCGPWPPRVSLGYVSSLCQQSSPTGRSNKSRWRLYTGQCLECQMTLIVLGDSIIVHHYCYQFSISQLVPESVNKELSPEQAY